MAWVGILFGTIAGICAAVLGFAVWSLPLWACLLLYPAAGVIVTAAVILLLLLRRTPAPETLRPVPARRPAAA